MTTGAQCLNSQMYISFWSFPDFNYFNFFFTHRNSPCCSLQPFNFWTAWGLLGVEHLMEGRTSSYMRSNSWRGHVDHPHLSQWQLWVLGGWFLSVRYMNTKICIQIQNKPLMCWYCLGVWSQPCLLCLCQSHLWLFWKYIKHNHIFIWSPRVGYRDSSGVCNVLKS